MKCKEKGTWSYFFLKFLLGPLAAIPIKVQVENKQQRQAASCTYFFPYKCKLDSVLGALKQGTSTLETKENKPLS